MEPVKQAKKIHVVIIDYGVGNLMSVSNALELLSVSHEIIESPAKLKLATHVILPGVGSFKMGMEGLRNGGWIEPLRKFALIEQKPILGICLGMQLLADIGYENGEFSGLSILPGVVEKIPVKNEPLPHIGWNDISTKAARITANLPEKPYFYFVHSYRFLPKSESIIVGTAQYGAPIVAIVESGNIYGAQFHPEKSQDNGVQILRNFTSV